MAEDTKDKGRVIDLAVTQIEKQFGKGSIMRLGDSPIPTIDAIPSGSLALGRSAWNRRVPERPGHRNLRTGIQRENNLDSTHNR